MYMSLLHETKLEQVNPSPGSPTGDTFVVCQLGNCLAFSSTDVCPPPPPKGARPYTHQHNCSDTVTMHLLFETPAGYSLFKVSLILWPESIAKGCEGGWSLMGA